MPHACPLPCWPRRLRCWRCFSVCPEYVTFCARRQDEHAAMTIGRAANIMIVTAVLLFMALPILVIAILSFSSASYLTFPPPAFGVRWYRAYLGSRDWLAATWLSIEVASAVVVLATVLGTLATLGLARLPRVARMLATGLILS